MKYFFIDEKRNIKKTYKDLINDINSNKAFNRFIYTKDVYKILLNIITSLINGGNTELLDMDLSKTELKSMGVDSKSLTEKARNECLIKDTEHLYQAIEDGRNDWRLTLYTSGTTGRPKKISHNLSTLARTAKVSEKFSDNIWAFCYNPTHFAGVQVFFQALLNRNTIVYAFDYQGDELCSTLLKNEVTNISATPTFYRAQVVNFKKPVVSIRYATLGGERFDKDLATRLKNIFPNAKIRNIYASTEAGSIFSSSDDYFTIHENNLNLVKINEDGELLIHQSLLGNSDDLVIKQGWYYTGDIVKKVGKDKFKIISRNTEMINIGGYKVNPNEVEDEIKKIAGVVDVLVSGKKNKLIGNVLQARIVKTPEVNECDLEQNIYNVLNHTLQRWKVPRIIRFVEKIDGTRSGKKVRK